MTPMSPLARIVVSLGVSLFLFIIPLKLDVTRIIGSSKIILLSK